MQGAEFLDQEVAGCQFQSEVEGALHENLYGFPWCHSLHLCVGLCLRSPTLPFEYLIGLSLVKVYGSLGRGKELKNSDTFMKK